MKCKYSRPDLDVDYYPNLLTTTLSQLWCIQLNNLFKKETRRTSLIFGNNGLIYRVQYRDTVKETLVAEWNELPGLLQLKNLVEAVTKQTYTVCIIQRYPNGTIGIAPHRDKEMVPGTCIAGISVGSARIMEFIRKGYEKVSIWLLSGSLYVMNAPSNEKWLHSIVKQPEIEEVRYSFTFRNY